MEGQAPPSVNSPWEDEENKVEQEKEEKEAVLSRDEFHKREGDECEGMEKETI